MSGIISGEGNDDVARRYHQRFKELTQMNHNRSVAPSAVGSVCESTISGKYSDNNKGQIGNRTLTTSQFYSNIPNQNSFQVRKYPSNQPDGSSTYTGVSDSSVFKKPMPVKRLNFKPHMMRRFDFMKESLCSIEDKQTLKFSMTAMEILVHTVKNPPYAPPVNPITLMDYIAQLVKNEYFSKRVPKSICGSSIISEPTVEEYPDPRVLQDITQASVARSQSTQHLDFSTMSRTGTVAPSYHQQEASMRSTLASLQPLDKQTDDGTLTASTFNFLNDSEIARRRDEAAVSQNSAIVVPKRRAQTFLKPTPKPKPPPTTTKRPGNGRSKVSAPASNDSILQAEKNISLLNGTTNGTTRLGRKLKPPVKYWSAKGEESSYLPELDESILERSMTLRNKKVLPNRGNKTNTPTLPIVTENDVSKPPTAVKCKAKPKSGKENKVAEKKNPAKKSSDSSERKKPSPKEKSNKKKEATNQKKEKPTKEPATKQKKEKPMKEPATKRKSKDLSNTTTKKKKVEDLSLSEEEDDIFGYAICRKPTQKNLKLALSPTAALLSAKKAAGEAQGKATPPCKTISDMMANESIHSTMSAAKDVPKQNDAIKRLVKKMEKNQMKPATQAINKCKVREGAKEDSQLNDIMEAVKSSYSANPLYSSATLRVFRGEERESDASDIEQDEDEDDDLM